MQKDIVNRKKALQSIMSSSHLTQPGVLWSTNSENNTESRSTHQTDITLGQCNNS